MIKFTSQIPLRTIRSLHKYMPEQTESGKAKEPSPFTTWLPTSVVLCPRIVRAVSAAYVTICSKARLKSHYSLIIRSSLTSPGEKFLAMLIFRVAELEGNDGHRGRPRPPPGLLSRRAAGQCTRANTGTPRGHFRPGPPHKSNSIQ